MPTSERSSSDTSGQRHTARTVNRPDDETIELGASESGPGEAVRLFARGDSIGRYVIMGTIGAGGMGVVYSAYDPELDRKLAIKVLRRAHTGARATEGQARLLKEAQALARLSHPNVVGVHDVGRFEDRVFIAMDFAEGRTLRDWLDEDERTWQEVVETFDAAGRGLAAAHAAELVHRDFKPENVVVGEDGRVRVLDFGLVRETGDTGRFPVASADASAGDSSSGSASGSARVTRAGALVGTPSYMAPEQYLGDDLSPATDQFAFCVSLFEALFGTHPFAGDTVTARAHEVLEGNVKTPRAAAEVPKHVRAALLRGLSVEQPARWPSMDALLDALGATPSRRRTRWALVGFTGAALAAAIALQESPAPPALCPDARAKIGEVWSETQRSELEQGFARTGRSYAQQSATRVTALVDDWTNAWAHAYRDTCEANRVRGEQSDELFDLRMRCLDHARASLVALLQLLAAPDDTVLENSVMAARQLPPIDRCNDAVGLRAGVPPPTDPEALDELDRLEAALARIRAQQHAGHYMDAATALPPLISRAVTLDHAPLTARMFAAHASILELTGAPLEAEPALLQAMHHAEVARDDDLLGELRVHMALIVGDRQARHAEGHTWISLARASLARTKGGPKLEARIDDALALIHASEGDVQRELHHHREALATLETAPNPDPTELAGLHAKLANALAQAGELDAAQRHAESALDTLSDELGEAHPRTAMALATRALVEDYRGNYRESLAMYTEALQRLEAVVGDANLQVAEILNNLAIAAINLDDLPRGEAAFRRVVEIKGRALGPEHLEVAGALGNLGAVLRMRGHKEEALTIQKQSLSILERELGAEHPRVATALSGLANAHESSGRPGEALPLRLRVLEILEKAYGPDHPGMVVDLSNTGWTHWLLKDPTPGRALAARAVAIADTRELKADVDAFARIVLARLLLAGDAQDPARAKALLQTAHDRLGDLPASLERSLMDEILAERGWTLKPNE